MPRIYTYETYWEDDDGGSTGLNVNYHYYPPSLGKRDSYGVPIEPDEDAQVEVMNIRTTDNQDPMLVFLDWDYDHAVQVCEARIIAEVQDEH